MLTALQQMRIHIDIMDPSTAFPDMKMMSGQQIHGSLILSQLNKKHDLAREGIIPPENGLMIFLQKRQSFLRRNSARLVEQIQFIKEPGILSVAGHGLLQAGNGFGHIIFHPGIRQTKVSMDDRKFIIQAP
ncbi:hypothetical protein ES703_56762 [subsurface metagenome]